MTQSLKELYSKPPAAFPHLPALAVFEREVRRFFNVPVQTLAGPIGSSLLYFAIFSFSIGRMASGANAPDLTHGTDYVQFLIPGIMAMEVVNAAFQNPVSSLLIAKWTGTIVDQLMAPLSPIATWFAYMGGALVRALLVATAAYVAGAIFSQNLPMQNFSLLLLSVFLTTVLFASLGVIAGVVCKSFDQVGMIGTFIIQPLVFLSGVFFSFQSLPESLHWLPFVNPIFFIVNMFRRAVIGVGDIDALTAFCVTGGFALVLSIFALGVLRRGTGLRT